MNRGGGDPRRASSNLSSLFSSRPSRQNSFSDDGSSEGGGERDEDALRYVAPKEPKANARPSSSPSPLLESSRSTTATSSASASASPITTGHSQASATPTITIIFSTSVRFYLFNPGSNAYEAHAGGAVFGCVILAGAKESLLIYDANRIPQLNLHIDAALDFRIQPNKFLSFLTQPAGILFDSEAVLLQFCRHLVAAKGHAIQRDTTLQAASTGPIIRHQINLDKGAEGGGEEGGGVASSPLQAGDIAGISFSLYELSLQFPINQSLQQAYESNLPSSLPSSAAERAGGRGGGGGIGGVGSDLLKVKVSGATEAPRMEGNGLEEALVGGKKGGKYLYLLPPRSVSSNRPHPEAWVLAEVEICKVKTSKGGNPLSSSSTPQKQHQQQEVVEVGSTHTTLSSSVSIDSTAEEEEGTGRDSQQHPSVAIQPTIPQGAQGEEEIDPSSARSASRGPKKASLVDRMAALSAAGRGTSLLIPPAYSLPSTSSSASPEEGGEEGNKGGGGGGGGNGEQPSSPIISNHVEKKGQEEEIEGIQDSAEFPTVNGSISSSSATPLSAALPSMIPLPMLSEQSRFTAANTINITSNGPVTPPRGLNGGRERDDSAVAIYQFPDAASRGRQTATSSFSLSPEQERASAAGASVNALSALLLQGQQQSQHGLFQIQIQMSDLHSKMDRVLAQAARLGNGEGTSTYTKMGGRYRTEEWLGSFRMLLSDFERLETGAKEGPDKIAKLQEKVHEVQERMNQLQEKNVQLLSEKTSLLEAIMQKSSDFASKEKEMQDQLHRLRSKHDEIAAAAAAGDDQMVQELLSTKADLTKEQEARIRAEEEIQELRRQVQALIEEPNQQQQLQQQDQEDKRDVDTITPTSMDNKEDDNENDNDAIKAAAMSAKEATTATLNVVTAAEAKAKEVAALEEEVSQAIMRAEEAEQRLKGLQEEAGGHQSQIKALRDALEEANKKIATITTSSSLSSLKVPAAGVNPLTLLKRMMVEVYENFQTVYEIEEFKERTFGPEEVLKRTRVILRTTTQSLVRALQEEEERKKKGEVGGEKEGEATISEQTKEVA